MTPKSVAELLARIRRDSRPMAEAHRAYELWRERHSKAGHHLAARRIQRAALAELLNPDTPGYGGSRER